jgi:predicted DNA binding CopG/RHH family protein
MKPTKTIPTFKDENEEREFWENNDIIDYLDTSKARRVRFPNLKKTTKSISIRLPVDMLNELKVRANSMDIPYQSFIKILLQEGLMKRDIGVRG